MAKAKGRVAAASMNASSGGAIGAGAISSNAIETAMSEATSEALARGIVDNDAILEIKLAARQRVKDLARAESAEDRDAANAAANETYTKLLDRHAKAAEKARKG